MPKAGPNATLSMGEWLIEFGVSVFERISVLIGSWPASSSVCNGDQEGPQAAVIAEWLDASVRKLALHIRSGELAQKCPDFSKEFFETVKMGGKQGSDARRRLTQVQKIVKAIGFRGTLRPIRCRRGEKHWRGGHSNELCCRFLPRYSIEFPFSRSVGPAAIARCISTEDSVRLAIVAYAEVSTLKSRY